MNMKDRAKICIVVGTRPGIIKMNPLIRECQKREISFFVLHTGQHYSPEMDDVFFKDLELKLPEFHLKNIKNYETHGTKTAMMIMGTEEVFIENKS